jgi:hypothetical protein
MPPNQSNSALPTEPAEHVFVSYSHGDAELVRPEIARLESGGVALWYDQGIEAGQVWREEIARAIKSARAMLYFVTPNSVASEYCRREVALADSSGVPIIAVHMQPTALPDGLDMTLAERQAIFYYEFEESAFREKLHRSLLQPEETTASYTPSTSTPHSGVGTRSWPSGSRLLFVALLAAFAIGVAWIWQLRASWNPSFAVIPFENTTVDPEQGRFIDGLLGELLTTLSAQAACSKSGCSPFEIASAS